MEPGRKAFWNNRRRELVAKACINLFQALFVAAFVSEAFLKAAFPWKVGFVIAMVATLVAGVVFCPVKGD